MPMRVQAGERLVEVDDLGRVQQAAGDGQLLFHAARKFARAARFVLSAISSSSSSCSATGS